MEKEHSADFRKEKQYQQLIQGAQPSDTSLYIGSEKRQDTVSRNFEHKSLPLNRDNSSKKKLDDDK